MIKTLGAIFLIVGGLVYLTYGTLSPCDALRETVRRQDGLARILPDALIDAVIESKFGTLSPGRCITLILQNEKPAIASTPTVVSPPAAAIPKSTEDPMIVAQKEAVAAIDECRNKRLNGELKTFVESARCANHRIVQAFSRANYRYMDLIDAFTTKRILISERIDRMQISEAEGQIENQKLFALIVEAEKQRDSARR